MQTITPTHEGRYGRQKDFHKIAEKNRAKHQEPCITGRHVCFLSPPLSLLLVAAVERLDCSVH